MDFARFTHLTFDCYGTLIDWESGILAALMPLLERHRISASEERVLRLYTQFEAEQEAGEYKTYRRVLQAVTESIAAALGFAPSQADLDVLPASLGEWPPFSDTVEALARLKERYRLVILSNVDDALFAETQKRLEVPFDAVITAEQAGSYKPARANFQFVLSRLGVRPDQVLHVAQSLYHDHVPAKELGFSTAWVNRRSRLPGTGLTPPAQVESDIEVPDLKSLTDAMEI